MHVAYVITRSDAMGGASVHVRDLSVAMNRLGHRATVVVGGRGGEVTERLKSAGVSFVLAPSLQRSIQPLRDVVAVAEVGAALRRLQPDLVSTHTAKAGLVGRLAAAALRIPAIYTPHGWTISDRISPWSGRLFRIAERAMAPLAAQIVNVCAAERDLALEHGIAALEKLAVVHNGVVDGAESVRANPGAELPRITMVARFEAPKDHDTLLAALATLSHLPWRLSLLGSGPLQPSVEALVQKLGLGGRVDFHRSEEPVAELLAASQIFVLSSRSEGFPRSILEAMRAGLPVVSSDVGGSCEAVHHGKSGLVVPREDRRAMAGALEVLLRSAALRVRFGSNARTRYETNFNFDAMFEKTLALYGRVVPRALPERATLPARTLSGEHFNGFD